MQQEESAGGVIVRKKAHSWEVLLMKDMKGNWTFPKGLIDPGESAQSAAEREIFEEVGVRDVELMAPLKKTHYMYTRGELIRKTVHYFLFTSKGKDALIPQTEEGVSEAKWISFDKAVKIIGYPKTNIALLEEVIGLIAVI